MALAPFSLTSQHQVHVLHMPIKSRAPPQARLRKPQSRCASCCAVQPLEGEPEAADGEAPCKLLLKLMYLGVGEGTLARAHAGAPATEPIPPGAQEPYTFSPAISPIAYNLKASTFCALFG